MRPALRWLGLLSGLAGTAILAVSQITYASDHDDGETDLKARALNLTDHFAFVNGSNLVLTMYVNSRSLPDTQYFLSTNARYEFHVSKAASKTATPTLADDYVFRFAAGAPDAQGVQSITLTLLENGNTVGSSTGSSTTFANSKANTVTTNTNPAGSVPVTWFVGMRADAFHFDVLRYFQVRSFLARRFFGGPGGTTGDATASLQANCEGHTFFQTTAPDSNGDIIHLWNPPKCAPDFTKNYNVIAIVLSVPLSSLSGTTFDTWSIITVKQ
jgi:hypothetical protein